MQNMEQDLNSSGTVNQDAEEIIRQANSLRLKIGNSFHDTVVESAFGEAATIASKVITTPQKTAGFSVDRFVDRVVTSRIWGFPIMLALLALVFWITVEGANVPSAFLASILVDAVQPWLRNLAIGIGTPWWIYAPLIDGAYLALAWVISVMLPPMAIFFPLFTFLEDFGYLPRVAFNMDNLFRKAGAHGKQALTMSMGFGCNAAGVVSTRIIDSPRERLIAIITNNFSLCNGRWPTQILIASIFIGMAVPPQFAGVASAGAVVSVALLGILLSLLVSRGLSRTVLKGEASAFSLVLPPYRPPKLTQILYTSLIDRTIFVLWRAIVFAAPAGLVIWLVGNLHIGQETLGVILIRWFDPVAFIIGLNGVIILAYIIAIPANEIVIPTILMLTVMVTGQADLGSGAGVMFESDSLSETASILQSGGWTALTGINLMLFSLLHNPCSTTIFTIYKETKSAKWTAVATFLPVIMGLVVCLVVAQVWRLIA